MAMTASNGQAIGPALTSPLLAEERKRMVVLQQQVSALQQKLCVMERQVQDREGQAGTPLYPSQESMARDASLENGEPTGESDVSPASRSLEEAGHKSSWRQQWYSKRLQFKADYFDTQDEDELIALRTRRPDEDFFIDVTSIFDCVLPNWSQASIDACGQLELHGGPTARMVPFLAILLTVPAYMCVPFVSLRLVLRLGSKASMKDRLVGALRLVAMGWLAWAPLLYLVCGDIMGDVRKHRTTFLTVSFPWWALAWFGYDVTNTKLCNACDKAVECMKTEVADLKFQVHRSAYGKSSGETWFRCVLQALTSPTDPKSMYPMFTMTEDDEPMVETLDKWKHLPIVALTSVQVLYALYPCFDEYCPPLVMAINLTAALAIGYASYSFCHDLGVKMVEFKDCVDEVRTFLFMVSPPEVRRSRRRRDEFLTLLYENAKCRQSCTVCRDTQHGTEQKQKITRPGGLWEEKLKKLVKDNRSGDLPLSQELGLEVRRVEVNLSTVPGVALFQHLQNWVWADIVNERFDIDTSASIICVMLMMLLGVALAPVIFEEQLSFTRVSFTQGVAFVDILAMLCYIGLCCNYCVQMNELLFEHVDRVLLHWKDHARSPAGVVAAVQTRAGKEERIQEFPGKGEPLQAESLGAHGPMEVRSMIDVTRERLRLQEPQMILGMKVTPALRAKLLSTLGTGGAAVAISLVKKHFGAS